MCKNLSNFDFAFSDTNDGWAYYSTGQLRHNSKGEGPKYGESYRAKDTIGVYVDLIDVNSLTLNSTDRD